MKTLIPSSLLCAVLSLLVFAMPVHAQDNEPATTDAVKPESGGADEATTPSSQEVEVNEDTYRQFMELKDANRQGDIIPETVYKPGSGLQKLDKLPEESQKHLRNELREIIVQGDPWQPGDENADYPYTPSEAASKNPALQKQEMEAWGELVDSYNQREAQIYADKSGNRAAMRPQDGKGEQPGGGADSEGEGGEDKEGIAGQPSKQESTSDQDATAGAFSPEAVNDPKAQSASGVSQNALEFLQGLGSGGNPNAEQTGTPPGNGGQQGSAGRRGQSQTGQPDTARQAGNTTTASQNPADGTDTGAAGVSQSAMDYLSQATAQNGRGDAAQVEQSAESTDGQEQDEGQDGSKAEGKSLASQQTETSEKTVSVPIPDDDLTFPNSESEEESTVGTTQNALEFLEGESARNGEVAVEATRAGPPPAGTLNIQDLLHAQGVGGTAGTEPGTSAAGEDKPTDETDTDKDGGGRW